VLSFDSKLHTEV